VFTFHDRTLTRTTGGSNTNACGDVDWNTISKLDVGSWGKWKRSKFAGTRPALLEEVLELAIDGRFIYVEVKTGPEIVPYVKEVFASQKKATPDNTLFISFNIESCRELKRLMPEYKVYWLSSCRKKVEGNYLPMSAEEILYYLNYAKVNGLDCRFDRANITREFISKIKSAGYECHVWTIDSLNTALEAFNRGAQTVTTNRAKFLLESYNKKKGEKGGCSSK
jgi:glycerophosphoryl diester phosphodiesterase